MPKTGVVPARLHVLMAPDAGRAVVIRRSPSKQVCTLLWDLQTDKFTLGQWFKGRIYERRSDLSADGKWLIYFAMNGKQNAQAYFSWTAISKAPYLKAEGLYAKGDCWHGGGLFLNKKSFWLNDGYGHQPIREFLAFKRAAGYPFERSYGGECLGVYYLRLQRDGWKYVAHEKSAKWKSVDIFEKKLRNGWTLRKLAHATLNQPVGKGCYYDTHELARSRAEPHQEFPDWEWAEEDGKRLVWAAEGKIFAAPTQRDGLGKVTELADLNAMKFEAIKAPY